MREAIARLHEFNRQYATKLKQNEKQWEEDILRQKMALQQKVRSQAPLGVLLMHAGVYGRCGLC